MSTGYQIKEQHGLHYLTFQVVNWADIFSRSVYRDNVLDSFRYAMEHKGFQCWCGFIYKQIDIAER